MKTNELEALVAAVLASGMEDDSDTPASCVLLFRQTLTALRASGGALRDTQDSDGHP